MKIRYNPCSKKWIVQVDVGNGEIKELQFDSLEKCEQWADHADKAIGEILGASQGKHTTSSYECDRQFRTGIRNKFLCLKHNGMLGVTYLVNQCVEHVLLT